MAHLLPSTPIVAFRDVSVKGGLVLVPVLVHGEWHGLQIPAAVARKIGHDLIGATAPDLKPSKKAPEATEEVSRDRCPLLKPKGALL